MCLPTIVTDNCTNLYGNDDDCDFWANRGDCDTNPDWMLPNCAKSCDSCQLNGNHRNTIYISEFHFTLFPDRQIITQILAPNLSWLKFLALFQMFM